MKADQLRRWERFFDLLDQGNGVSEAAKGARLDRSTCYRFRRNDPKSPGLEAASILGRTEIGGKFVAPPMRTEALKALEDFAYFRRRYFGRESTPWQVRAAYEMLSLLETPDKEYAVVNMPPGSGKSTLFTCDIPTWLIVRDRTIRILIGSGTLTKSTEYVNRIKRALSRTSPLQASMEEVEAGIAFDAEGCLSVDFGVFKPPNRSEKWRADSFVVQQLDGTSVDDKEDTVRGVGIETDFLGWRGEFCIWDDLVTGDNMATQGSRDKIRRKWDQEAENRIEKPRGSKKGGVIVLQGQRLSSNDLYRWCLDKRNADDTPKYRHLVYKAHYDDLCTGEHDHITKAWPESCLLDPWRLDWKFLGQQMQNKRLFQITYQQEDVDLANSLVDMVWIKGGTDEDGYRAPGCLDKDRYLNDPPPHLKERGWSFVTVDPSPSEFWGIIHWLYDPDTQNMYIINIKRARLSNEQFISYDLDYTAATDSSPWSGLVADWTKKATILGIPIQHWIVEQNAAQKWLLPDQYVQKWQKVTGQIFIPHQTGGYNTNDPKYGLNSIADLFRQGRIRIPWGDIDARNTCGILIDEVTRFPDFDTTDLAMSTWFARLGIANSYSPQRSGIYQLPRPAFMRREYSRGIA